MRRVSYQGMLGTDGSDGAPPAVYVRLGADAIATRRKEARKQVRVELSAPPGPAMLELGMCGTPEHVAERCCRLLDAGARHVSFGPPLGPDRRRAVRQLGERVLPRLRA